MVRHLRPYSDAFMELKEYQEADSQQIKRVQTNQPQIHLQSKKVQEAINSKIEEGREKQISQPNPQNITGSSNQIVKATPSIEYQEEKSPVRRQQQNNGRIISEKKGGVIEISDEGQRVDNGKIQVSSQQRQTKKQKQGQFHNRREQSANPKVSTGLDLANQLQFSQKLEEYQHQVEQFQLKQEGNQRQPRHNPHNHPSKPLKSEESVGVTSLKSYQNLNSQPIPIQNVPQNHNNRHWENQGKNSLDLLKEPKKVQNHDEDFEVEFIQSKNIKLVLKNGHRELRAPSSGSSGSQPRVVAVGGDKSVQSHHSVNSSGIQRRYDSIEHQRKSQIDKFLQNPQDQILSMMNQKKKIQMMGDKYQSNKEIKKKIPVESVAGYGQNGLIPNKESSTNVKTQIDSNIYHVVNQKPNSSLKRKLASQNQNSTRTRQKGSNSQQINEIESRRSSQNKETSHLRGSSKNSLNQTRLDQTQQNQINGLYFKQLQQKLSHYNNKRKSRQSNGEELDEPFVSNEANDSSVAVQSQKMQSSPGKQQVHRKAKSVLNNNYVRQSPDQEEEGKEVKMIQSNTQGGNVQNLVANSAPQNKPLNTSDPNGDHQVQKRNNLKEAQAKMGINNKGGITLKLKQSSIRNKTSQGNNSLSLVEGEKKSQPINFLQSNESQTKSQKPEQVVERKKAVIHSTKNQQNPVTNFDFMDQKQQLIDNRTSLNQIQVNLINEQKLKLNLHKGLNQSLNQENKGFLQSLIKEYEKSQQLTSTQLVANKSQLSDQLRPQAHEERVGKQVKIIKTVGGKQVNIENIQRQICQNQKAMANMTQNLFQKNNNGRIMLSQQKQKIKDYSDEVESVSIKKQPEPSSRDSQRRQPHHQQPSKSHSKNSHSKNHQPHLQVSSQTRQKIQDRGSLFQTQDTRQTHQLQDSQQVQRGQSSKRDQRVSHPLSATAAQATTINDISKMISKLESEISLNNASQGVRRERSNDGTKQKELSQRSEANMQIQVSSMTKYNLNQQHLQKTQFKEQGREKRSVLVTQSKGSGVGQTRHNSAPKEATHHQRVEEELWRQNVTASIEMLQSKGGQKAPMNLKNQRDANYYKKQSDIQNLNLSQFGDSKFLNQTSQPSAQLLNQRIAVRTTNPGSGLTISNPVQSYEAHLPSGQVEISDDYQQQNYRTPNQNAAQLQQKSKFNLSDNHYSNSGGSIANNPPKAGRRGQGGVLTNQDSASTAVDRSTGTLTNKNKRTGECLYHHPLNAGSGSVMEAMVSQQQLLQLNLSGNMQSHVLNNQRPGL